MSAKNLSTATTELIESYGNTAKNVINAYRVGNERVIGFVDQRWETALEKTGRKLSAEVRGNALAAQKKLSSYYTQGITLTSDGADTLVTKVVEIAGKGVQQAAANAGQFEKKTGVKALHSLALAAVPAVEAVNKLAVSLEKQSSRLASKLAGKAATVKAASVKAATVKVAAVKRVTPFRKARARKVA